MGGSPRGRWKSMPRLWPGGNRYQRRAARQRRQAAGRAAWQKLALLDPPEAVRRNPNPDALNTGILCNIPTGADVDVPILHLSDQIVTLAETMLGITPFGADRPRAKNIAGLPTGRPVREGTDPRVIRPDGRQRNRHQVQGRDPRRQFAIRRLRHSSRHHGALPLDRRDARHRAARRPPGDHRRAGQGVS